MHPIDLFIRTHHIGWMQRTASQAKSPPAASRSEATRERLIAAALDLFGRRGFDGVATREIARQAKANQAAIPYHFQSKQGLYAAVAGHVANELTTRSGPVIAAIEQRLSGDAMSPAEAGELLRRLIREMAAIIVGQPEAALWARFIIREQLDPTPAFDIIYAVIEAGPLRMLLRLLARITDKSETSQIVRLRAFALVGQVLAFRLARAAVLRRLGWKDIGAKELAAVQAVIDTHVAAILVDASR